MQLPAYLPLLRSILYSHRGASSMVIVTVNAPSSLTRQDLLANLDCPLLLSLRALPHLPLPRLACTPTTQWTEPH
jgi:hypothetical protein